MTRYLTARFEIKEGTDHNQDRGFISARAAEILTKGARLESVDSTGLTLGFYPGEFTIEESV